MSYAKKCFNCKYNHSQNGTSIGDEQCFFGGNLEISDCANGILTDESLIMSHIWVIIDGLENSSGCAQIHLFGNGHLGIYRGCNENNICGSIK